METRELTVHHAELMAKVREISSSASSYLLDRVVSASVCLEGKDKESIKGSASDIRKSKSLVGRWLNKYQDKDNQNKCHKESDDVFWRGTPLFLLL